MERQKKKDLNLLFYSENVSLIFDALSGVDGRRRQILGYEEGKCDDKRRKTMVWSKDVRVTEYALTYKET